MKKILFIMLVSLLSAVGVPVKADDNVVGAYINGLHPISANPDVPMAVMIAGEQVLLDRIDIQVEIVPVPFEEISKSTPGESSASIRERVIQARQIQAQRFAGQAGIYSNAQMTPSLLHRYAQPDAAGLELLRHAMHRLNLSARAYDRILKVSRTIADLENSTDIRPEHLAEAISYRNLDRENWAG